LAIRRLGPPEAAVGAPFRRRSPGGRQGAASKTITSA
jgi:hypothetical protein